MTFHSAAISDTQSDLLRILGPLASENEFYLAGGTAVALQLGHRRSIDFDWFSPQNFDPMALAQAIHAQGIEFETDSIDKGTLYGSAVGVQVAFLEYRYPLLDPLLTWPEYEMSMASLGDLACMKLNAVAQRGSKKDFIDVYALIREHRPLSDLIDLYERKYASVDVGHLLYALSYFDTADEEPTPEMLWDVDWPDVKKLMASWVKTEASRR